MVLIMSVFVSCFEDLPIDFPNEIVPELVIESVLRDDTNMVEVYVSETISLNDSLRDFKGLNNAKVTLSDNAGNVQQLILSNDGKYTGELLEKEVGTDFNLEVEVNDLKYSASESMFSNNIVDSIFVRYIKDKDYYEEGYYIVSSIKVNEEKKQFFRLVLTVNDIVLDNYVDLLLFETSLLANEIEVIIPYAFKSGDMAKMELFSFSEEMYRYWNAYYQITNGFLGNPTAPSQNPPSNISGGCLGYFQVSSVKTYFVEIP